MSHGTYDLGIFYIGDCILSETLFILFSVISRLLLSGMKNIFYATILYKNELVS